MTKSNESLKLSVQLDRCRLSRVSSYDVEARFHIMTVICFLAEAPGDDYVLQSPDLILKGRAVASPPPWTAHRRPLSTQASTPSELLPVLANIPHTVNTRTLTAPHHPRCVTHRQIPTPRAPQ